jgi:hypothetical protein
MERRSILQHCAYKLVDDLVAWHVWNWQTDGALCVVAV